MYMYIYIYIYIYNPYNIHVRPVIMKGNSKFVTNLLLIKTPLPCASGNSLVLQWQSSVPEIFTPVYTRMPLEKEMLVASAFPLCFQCSSSGLPVVLQCVPIMQINTESPLGYQWDLASASVVPVVSQIIVGLVVFQCVPIMQINTGSPLGNHCLLTSASVVPVTSQCTCGSSGLPAWFVQWYPSVLTESGLEVIGSGHSPAYNPLFIQLVWWGLLKLNWFHLNCHPKHTKTIMVLISNSCTRWCWSTHMF